MVRPSSSGGHDSSIETRHAHDHRCRCGDAESAPVTASARIQATLEGEANPREQHRDKWIVTGLCVLFIGLVVAMGGLWKYKNAPGEQSDAPARWPAESRIERDPGLPTLVMFAHPMCPCTRASLSELRAIMSEFQGRVAAHVLFAMPDGVSPAWSAEDSWAAAASIPGVRVQRDEGEREAVLFGAKTSGHVVLYVDAGDLLFRGGITSSRGHVGDNPGRARLTAILRQPSTKRADSPVFGCPLEEPHHE